MHEEINPIEALKTIRFFLKKFAFFTYKSIEEPKITLDVYYKTGEGKGVVAIENAEIDIVQRNICRNLLQKMIETNASTSKDFDRDYDQNVGAVSTEKMIIVMAGVENMAAKVIIVKALQYAQVITIRGYEDFKKELEQNELFEIIEKGDCFDEIINLPNLYWYLPA